MTREQMIRSDGKYEGCQTIPILPLLYLGTLLGSPHPSAAMRKIPTLITIPDVVGIAAIMERPTSLLAATRASS